MPRKKKPPQKELDLIAKAESLVKHKPREFVIGFITLIGLVIVFAYLSIYFYSRTLSSSKPEIRKTSTVLPTNSQAKYYILKEGESLSDVAEREYGDGQRYPTLIELNNLQNPDLVEPGMKIRVK